MDRGLLSNYQLKKINSFYLTKTLIISRTFPNELKIKPKLQLENNISMLLQNLQTFKEKFLSGTGLIVHNQFLITINEP